MQLPLSVAVLATVLTANAFEDKRDVNMHDQFCYRGQISIQGGDG